MKRLTGVLIITIFITILPIIAYAGTTLSQSTGVSVGSVLSIEYASTSYCVFPGQSISWLITDPAADYIRPTGYDTTGVKSDVGLIARYNGTAPNWYVKMRFESANLAGKVCRYITQPNLRDSDPGTATDGAVAGGTDWIVIPSTDATVYTSGTNDRINTPNGVYIGINLCLRPEALSNSSSYSGTIYYTITTTP